MIFIGLNIKKIDKVDFILMSFNNLLLIRRHSETIAYFNFFLNFNLKKKYEQLISIVYCLPNIRLTA